MKKTLLVLALSSAALAFSAQAQTQRASRIEAGTLECNVEGGVGLIVGSQREMACRFTSQGGRRTETYVGRVTRLGVDIGVTGQQKIVWSVFAPTTDFTRGALAGTYAGVGAQASAGVGLGANALVGGSNQTFALQPVSVQAQTGVNVAAGITGMELIAAR